VQKRLEEGGSTVLLTPTVISPSAREVVRKFIQSNPNTEWIQYDEVSASGIREAHLDLFGAAVIPGYHFNRAEYILSFDADFLGTWLSPVEFTRGYAETRELSKENPHMSKHIQVESGLSMTGSNADERYPVTPGESMLMLGSIYNKLVAGTASPGVSAPQCESDVSRFVEDLQKHKGKSIVVSGSNDPSVQKLVAGINYLLDNYGATLDLERTIELKKGNDKEFFAFQSALEKGEVDNLLMVDVNPVYSLGNSFALDKAGFTLYMGTSLNETAEASQVICPDHHYLEAWGDAEAVKGSYSLQQPCIHPIFSTRSWQDSLLVWAGQHRSYHDFLQYWWETEMAPPGEKENTQWWEKTLQSGLWHDEKVPQAVAAGYSAPNVEIQAPQVPIPCEMVT